MQIKPINWLRTIKRQIRLIRLLPITTQLINWIRVNEQFQLKSQLADGWMDGCTCHPAIHPQWIHLLKQKRSRFPLNSAAEY